MPRLRINKTGGSGSGSRKPKSAPAPATGLDFLLDAADIETEADELAGLDAYLSYADEETVPAPVPPAPATRSRKKKAVASVSSAPSARAVAAGRTGPAYDRNGYLIERPDDAAQYGLQCFELEFPATYRIRVSGATREEAEANARSIMAWASKGHADGFLLPLVCDMHLRNHSLSFEEVLGGGNSDADA